MTKPNLNIIFVGHVDSGKSTACGCLLQANIELDPHEQRRITDQSHMTDIDEAERVRGKTHETAMIQFELKERKITLLDAPGHKGFVSSMIDAVTQADVAILVVSARRGEFEAGFHRDGQTKEHVILAKTAGVKYLLIAINKLDDITVNWDKGVYNSIKLSIIEWLAEIKWKEANYQFIPMSARTGEGVVTKVKNNSTLQELLTNIPIPKRVPDDILRMSIVGCHKDGEGKRLVYGKVLTGRINSNDKVLILPKASMAIVQGFESMNTSHASSGDNVVISLKCSDDIDMRPGYLLTQPISTIRAATTFHANILLLRTMTGVISSGFSCILHCQCTKIEMTVDELLATVTGTNKIIEKYPPFVAHNCQVVMKITLLYPCCIEEFKKNDKMGRVMLRDRGQTIGIGIVTKILN